MRPLHDRHVVKTRLTWLLGLAALFSGAALLAHILFGVSLLLGLLVIGAGAAALAALATRQMTRSERRRTRSIVLAGCAAGIVATIGYDAAKTVLSQLDPSPFDPFEATRAFGFLLLGDQGPPIAREAAGVGLHLLNGTAFGVAFTILFAREGRLSVSRAVLYGVGWGLFLELFQLTLYPGWLDIRTYREFATITALSHVVYGGTLGLVGRWFLRRIGPPEALLERERRAGLDKW
jgi:hypothetical protein